MLDFLRKPPKQVQVPVPESPHQQLIGRIKKINADLALRVFSPDIASLAIRASFKSIQEYNHFLRLIIPEMKNPKGIRPSFFQALPSVYLLKDWFVSNGFYLDTEEETNVFKERATQFVELYMELEAKATEDQKRTFPSLGRIMSQIKEITDHLIVVTKKDEDPVLKTRSAIRREGI